MHVHRLSVFQKFRLNDQTCRFGFQNVRIFSRKSVREPLRHSTTLRRWRPHIKDERRYFMNPDVNRLVGSVARLDQHHGHLPGRDHFRQFLLLLDCRGRRSGQGAHPTGESSSGGRGERRFWWGLGGRDHERLR